MARRKPRSKPSARRRATEPAPATTIRNEVRKPTSEDSKPESIEGDSTAPSLAVVPSTGRPKFWTPPRLIVAVVALVLLHGTLAVDSLLRENPTVDEVAHLPAGVSYWEQGTFRLYHHNPPLIKLIAALPVILAGPTTDPLYEQPSWTNATPSHPFFAHEFAALNADRYLDLMTLARLTIPPISMIGAVVLFLWTRRLYGDVGALLSLSLYAFAPNILAHARLVTTDIGATVIGLAANFAYALYLQRPGWIRAFVAGGLLGIGCLIKFSLLLLFGLWPLLWLVHTLLRGDRSESFLRWLRRYVLHALTALTITLGLINAGYGFEGTFTRLGDFEFYSATLTRPFEREMSRDPGFLELNGLQKIVAPHRINRFRNTILGAIPVPLPVHFLLGFDEQKVEADGIPARFVDPNAPPDATLGYPVYLDGILRETGWETYYLQALRYKLPEGTLILIGLAILSFPVYRPQVNRADEAVVAIIPIVYLLVFTFATDINIGLRYVLPMLPFLFLVAGRVGAWCADASGPQGWLLRGLTLIALLASIASSLSVHPHYLAHFNRVSGGPDRGSEHLIDSNLDWGQDLITLHDWMLRNAPDEPVGLAYFGQIHPKIVLGPADISWFVPPSATDEDGSPLLRPQPLAAVPFPEGPIRPGLYAVSASLLRGLPYPLYDPRTEANPKLYPSWDRVRNLYAYFQSVDPITKLGYSIFVYRLDESEARRLEAIRTGRRWGSSDR